jgi:lysophospholipase L1-like esterase
MFRSDIRTMTFLRVLRAYGMVLLLGGQISAQVRILPLGDSITWGKVNQNPPGAGSSGYRGPLHTLLTDNSMSTVFVGTDPDNTDLNRGYYLDGGKIGDFLGPDSLKGDIAAVLDGPNFQPDIVILHIGTNNIGSGQAIGTYNTPNSMMQQLYTMVKKITNNSYVDDLLLCKVIPKYSTPGTETETQAFNNALEIMVSELTAMERAKVTIIDMYAAFAANKTTYYNYDIDRVHPNSSGYATMANIFYHFVAQIMQPSYTDEFNRAAIGAEWVVRPGVQIVNTGETPTGGGLKCTTVGSDDWYHMAIWSTSKNLTTVSMKIHSSTTAAQTDKVGLIVGLDAASTTANGYLVWVYNNAIRIKTLVGGRAGWGYGQDVTNWPLTNLSPGDVFKVSYRQAADANYFTIVVNNDEENAIVLRDRFKLTGNTTDLYSGVLFTQNSSGTAYNVVIDRFMAESQRPDIIAPSRIGDLSVEFTTNTSITLGWTAPGNDESIGTASSYDIRYSTSAITNESDFARANIVSGVSTPKESGTWEVFSVTGLQSGIGYYFAMRAVDGWGNKGDLSPAVYARTNSAGQIIETFNRPTELDGTIGPDWLVDGTEYRIDYNSTTHEGELTNYQVDGNWGRVAVYQGRTNPSIVKMVWGRGSTTAGIGQAGFALMLTAPSMAADGYLLWVRTQSNRVFLYNIENGEVDGSPGGQIDEVPYTLRDNTGSLRPPRAGDTLAVVMDWNYEGGHKFDVYLNGLPIADRSMFDPDIRHNSTTKYAGIMLGRLNQINNVTDFITVAEATTASRVQKVGGDAQSAVVGSDLPDSLKVQVFDANNTPLSGVPVFFNIKAPADGATITAPPEPMERLPIEAEWAVFSGPYYVRTDNPGASGGKYIVSPIRGGEGKASFTFYSPRDTTYYFWIRVIVPDASHYALQFQLEESGTPWTNNLFQSSPSSQWQWGRIRNGSSAVATARLSKGLHKIILTSLHENLPVDKILLTPSGTYVPTTTEATDMLFTDVGGRVGTKMTLGIKAKDYEVEARPFGVAEGDGAKFTETGLAATPIAMFKTNDEQSGVARAVLPRPFIVTLYDTYGNKAPNVRVTFQITEGDGTLSAAADTTDANGQAKTTLTLGVQSATNKVKANFTGYTGAETVFSALTTTGLVRTIQKMTGTVPAGKHYVGDIMPNFVKARVLDDASRPVANVAVTFQVTQGSALPGVKQPKMTDAAGIVQDTLRLGNAAGIVQVTARIGALQAVVATDSCYYKARRVQVAGSNRQNAPISDSLQNKLRVWVTDRFGNSVRNQPVIFRSYGHGFYFRTATDSTDSVVVLTDVNGWAATNVRTGSICGSFTDIVQAKVSDGFKPADGSPVKFTIRAYSKAVRLIQLTGDNQTVVVNEMADDPLAVQMVDASRLPVMGQPVEFAIRPGGYGRFTGDQAPKATVYTNENGIASIDYIAGTKAGVDNVIEVNANNGLNVLTDSTGTPIVFHIYSKSSDADSIKAASAIRRTGVAGKPLALPISAQIVDAIGNPVGNDSIRFTVVLGNGVLDGTASNTKVVYTDNAFGTASVVWTLGPRAGTDNNVLWATAYNGLDSLHGSPVVFTASATSDSVSVITSTVTASGPVKATENDTCRITVTLLDGFLNPVQGKRVRLEVAGGTNNFPQDPTVPTNAQGKAFGYLRSLSAGQKIIRAYVVDDAKWLFQRDTVLFENDKAYKIQAHSGGGQSGNVGTLLQDSLVVKVMDVNGNPASFGPVHFEVTGGSGRLYGSTDVHSNDNGLASAKLILGPNPGENVVRVTSGTLVGSPFYFSATGKAGAAVAMRMVSGSGQNGPAGDPLPRPLVVQVVDKELKPVYGVNVTFSVYAGIGTILTPQPSVTDAFGFANAILQTASQAGQTCWIRAENASLSNSPQLFSATSAAGTARRIVKVSGDGQSGFVGETIQNPIVVSTTDKYGNAVSGVAVLFTVISGDATLGGQSSLSVASDGAGRAYASVRLGQTSGSIVIEATSTFLEGSPVVFNLLGRTINAASIEKFSGDNQKGRLGLPFVDPLRVRVLDVYRNPVPGIQVVFEKYSGGGTIVEPQPVTSDADGIASVRFVGASTPGVSAVRAWWGTGTTVTFTLESVINPNNPLLARDLIQPSYDIYERDDLTIPLVGSDSDGDVITFQIANLFPPEGSAIQSQTSGPGTATATFRWTPSYEQAGTHTIVLRVVDGRGGVDSDTTVIRVANLNQLPFVQSKIPVADDTTCYAGDRLSFLVDARDPDGDGLHYYWKWDGTMVGSDLPFLEYTPSESNLGNHTVDCMISDGYVSISRRWTVKLVALGVEMTAMAASFNEDDVTIAVEWSTASETNTVGFEIGRATSLDGEYRVITPDLIPCRSDREYRYEDTDIQVGRNYYYKIYDVDGQGNRNVNGPIVASVPMPKKFGLTQNYPNPFNPVTTIRYQVTRRQRVTLTVYDVMGRCVALLADRDHDAGYYSAEWDGRDRSGKEVSTGVYIYRLSSPDQHRTLKMVKLK